MKFKPSIRVAVSEAPRFTYFKITRRYQPELLPSSAANLELLDRYSGSESTESLYNKPGIFCCQNTRRIQRYLIVMYKMIKKFNLQREPQVNK